MVRTPFYDKSGLKKGAWSAEEDRKLTDYILRYGHWNWRELPKFAGLKRCGKSCRLRWMNYLRPDIKHGNYTKEEEELIIQLHQQLGNKWSKISSKLPGRTDNEIKNYWHAHLEKSLGKQMMSQSKARKQQPSQAMIYEPNHKRKPCSSNHVFSFKKDQPSHVQILESCPLLSLEESSANELSSLTSEIATSNLSSSTDKLDENSIGPSNIFPELDDVSFRSNPSVLDNFDTFRYEFTMNNAFLDGASPCESYYQDIDFSFMQEFASLDYQFNN